MSLLMDALKRAEETKRREQAGAEAPAADTPPAQSVDASPAAPADLPDLPDLHDLPEAPEPPQAPGREFHVEPEADKPTFLEPPPVVTPAAAPARNAVQNVFAAKQPTGGNPGAAMVALGIVGLLGLAAIFAYYWYALKAEPQPTALVLPPPKTPARPADPLPLPTEPTATGDSPVLSAPRVTPPPAAAESPASPIRITAAPAKVNPALTVAFEAFREGDLPRARAAYERVLRSEPRNADALRGVAAIALRENRPDAARDAYHRLLDADPSDAGALAGLLGLDAPSDPTMAESRLKTLLARQPKAAALSFALGNLYAGQNRWSEAQQAYFRAVAADGDNPDYLLNLAVSLDQLHQPKLAAQYYRQALAAIAKRPAAFDADQVAARLQALQP